MGFLITHMQRVRKLCVPAMPGQRLLLQAAVMLPLTGIGLRLFGFRRVFIWLDRLAGIWSAATAEEVTQVVEQARHAIRYLRRNGPYRGNCLSRSLVLWWLLRRHGIECELRIGTRKEAGQFIAHAWVEYQGEPLNAGRRVREHFVTFDYAFSARGAHKHLCTTEE